MTGPASRERDPWSRWAIAGGLVALVAWSFWQRWLVLTESPFPLGIDGYFYPIQLRALLDHGSLAYPSSPAALWLMAPLAAITDPVTGAKLGAAIGGALIALPIYAVGARLARDRGAGLVAAVLATTSAGSMYLTFEFVKNGIGLTIAVTALWLVLRAVDQPRRLRAGVAVIAVLAAMLTHKMAAALVLVLAGPAVVAALVSWRGRTRTYAVLALGVTLGAAVIAGLVSPTRLLSPRDLALLDGLVQATAHWDAPALVTPAATLAVGHEAAIGGVLAIAVIAHWLIGGSPALPRSELAASVASVVLALLIALPWLGVDDPQGLGFRLRLAAFVPMALCGAHASRLVIDAIRRIAGQRTSGSVELAVLAALAIAIVMVVPARRTDGRLLTHPALVTSCIALAERVPPGDVVIVPERHIAFMAAWYAGVSVRLRPEGIARARRWRLMPLASIGAGSPLDDALIAARREPALVPPVGLHPKFANGLVLVSEPTWEWVLERLPAKDRRVFEAWPTL
ncbi:MAG: glycosyltransferase family 39 protein [Kofleriaceae bacterium]